MTSSLAPFNRTKLIVDLGNGSVIKEALNIFGQSFELKLFLINVCNEV